MGDPADDAYVRALQALCVREGGHEAVADTAKVSAANLWQILNGTKLPSGQPRGVGPTLRRKLTDAFPDWLMTNQPFSAGSDATAAATGNTQPIQFDRAASSAGVYYTPAALLRQLAALCAPMDLGVRRAVGQLVASAIEDPATVDSAAAAIDALASVQAKRVEKAA